MLALSHTNYIFGGKRKRRTFIGQKSRIKSSERGIIYGGRICFDIIIWWIYAFINNFLFVNIFILFYLIVLFYIWFLDRVSILYWSIFVGNCLSFTSFIQLLTIIIIFWVLFWVNVSIILLIRWILSIIADINLI